MRTVLASPLSIAMAVTGRPRARAPIIITIITTNVPNTKNSSLCAMPCHAPLRTQGTQHVQAMSKEDKMKPEPSVATGCVDGSTPMAWHGMAWHGVWLSLNFECNDRRNEMMPNEVQAKFVIEL